MADLEGWKCMKCGARVSRPNNGTHKCLPARKEGEWFDAKKVKPQGVWSKFHPHLSEEVLIANSCSVNIGFYNRDDGTWYVDEPAAKQWIDKITHWMPLPKNPHGA